MIHSAAEVNHPSEQGITGVVEVFLDTFVICTITGLTLGVTGVLDSGVDGSVLAIYAFGSVWPPLVLWLRGPQLYLRREGGGEI